MIGLIVDTGTVENILGAMPADGTALRNHAGQSFLLRGC